MLRFREAEMLSNISAPTISEPAKQEVEALEEEGSQKALPPPASVRAGALPEPFQFAMER